MLKFMEQNISGPWDMYTLCSALQRHYTQAVMPVLDLQVAANDGTRGQLQDCIENVLVTRSWFGHGSGHLTVAECTRAMQSLIEILGIIVPVVLPCTDANAAIASIRSHIQTVETALANLDLGVFLPIRFQACLTFMRAMHKLREAAASKGLSSLHCDIADENGALKAISKAGIHGDYIDYCELVKKGRNYIFHGKNNDETIFLLLCTCAVEQLLRFLCTVGKSPDPQISDEANSCESSALQLMKCMGMNDVNTLVTEFVKSRSTLLSACPYRGCLKGFPDLMHLRHLLSRSLPFECPPSSVKIISANKVQLVTLLRIVKKFPRMLPDGSPASDSDAVSWLLGNEGHSCLEELSQSVACNASSSVPSNASDVQLLFAAIKVHLLKFCCTDTGSLPADCSGWALLQHMLPELEKKNVVHNVKCCCASEIDATFSVLADNYCLLSPEKQEAFHENLRTIVNRHLPVQAPPRTEPASCPKIPTVTLAWIAFLASSGLRDRVNKMNSLYFPIISSSPAGLGMRAAISHDDDFIAREEERAAIIGAVTSVMDGTSHEPRRVLLLHGHPGLGKSILATQALRSAQKCREHATSSLDVRVEIVRGRGDAVMNEDLVAMGRNLGNAIGVASTSPQESVLAALKCFLSEARYVLLIDDADSEGLKRALKFIPASKQRCTLIITSQSLTLRDVSDLLAEVRDKTPIHFYKSLDPFTHRECMQLMAKVWDKSEALFLLQKEDQLRDIFCNGLGYLPLAVRLFAIWSRTQFKTLMGLHADDMKKACKAAKDAALKANQDQDKAEAQSRLDYDAATGHCSAAAIKLLDQWTAESKESVFHSDVRYTRGLLGTVRLALLQLTDFPHHSDARQLLVLLAFCPPSGHGVWSLFDHEVTFSNKYPHIQKPLLHRLKKKNAFASIACETALTGLIHVDFDMRKISMHQLLQHAIRRVLIPDLEQFQMHAEIALSLVTSRARVHEKQVTPEMDAFWLEICDVLVYVWDEICSIVNTVQASGRFTETPLVAAGSAAVLTAQTSCATAPVGHHLVKNMIETIISRNKHSGLQGVAMLLYKLGFHQRSFDILGKVSILCSDELLEFRHCNAICELRHRTSKEGYLGYNWKQLKRNYLEVAINEFRKHPNLTLETRTKFPDLHSGQNGSDWNVNEFDAVYQFIQGSFDYLASNLQSMQTDPKTYSILKDALLGSLHGIRDWAFETKHGLHDTLGLSKRIHEYFGDWDFHSLKIEFKEAYDPRLVYLCSEIQLIHYGIKKHGQNEFASGYIYESMSDLHLCYLDSSGICQGDPHFGDAIKCAQESLKCACKTKGKHHQRRGLLQMKLAYCLYRNQEFKPALLYASLALCMFEDLRGRRTDQALSAGDWFDDCGSLIARVLKEMGATESARYLMWLSTSFRGTEHTHFDGKYQPSADDELYLRRLYQKIESVNGTSSLCDYFTSFAKKTGYSVNLDFLVPELSMQKLRVQNESNHIAQLDNLLRLYHRALQSGYFAVPVSSEKRDFERFLVEDEKIRRVIFRALLATETETPLMSLHVRIVGWLELCKDLMLPSLIEEQLLQRQQRDDNEEEQKQKHSRFSELMFMRNKLESNSSFTSSPMSHPPVTPEQFDEMFNKLYAEFRSKLKNDDVRRRFLMYFQLPSQILVCTECHKNWEFAAGEKLFFEEKKLHVPKKCKPCRETNKPLEEQKNVCAGGV